MRYRFHIITFVLSVLVVQNGISQGMIFETGNWASILKKAEKENKLIYLDAYTSWCGPCKLMKKNIFPDAKIGEYFNSNFVNAQIDMEKGEGPGLASKYSVNAYPTHLFINGKGELVHLGLGYMEGSAFIDLGKQANDPNQQYASLRKKYEAGSRDENLLRNYMNILYQMSDPMGEKVASEYFKTQSDLTTDDNIRWLNAFAISPSSPNHHVLLENKEVITRKLQTQFLSNLAYSYFVDNVKKGLKLEDAQKAISAVYPEKSGILSFYTAVYYSKKNKDTKAYEDVLFSYLTPENLDQFASVELNSYAWYVYESVEDADKVRQAIKWAQASVDKSSEYANNDTLAWLYYKAGDAATAKKIAQKAIDIGKASGEDTSSTEELLTK